MTLRTTPLKSECASTTAEVGAVAVGVSTASEAERAQDRDVISHAVQQS